MLLLAQLARRQRIRERMLCESNWGYVDMISVRFHNL